MNQKREDFNNYLYQQALQLARIGSWEFDLVTNKICWSAMVHELHETNPKTFQPDVDNSINFYREDFRPMVKEVLEACFTSGAAFDYEAVIITKKKGTLGSDYWKCRAGSGRMPAHLR
jgi:hypothetical protein